MHFKFSGQLQNMKVPDSKSNKQYRRKPNFKTFKLQLISMNLHSVQVNMKLTSVCLKMSDMYEHQFRKEGIG